MEFGRLPVVQLQGITPPQEQDPAGRMRRAAKREDVESIRQASQDFEAIFVQRLLKEMRKSIPKGGVIERSLAQEWFEGMLDEAVAREVSRSKGLGLSQALFEQMRKRAGLEEKGGGKPAGPSALSAAPPEEREP